MELRGCRVQYIFLSLSCHSRVKYICGHKYHTASGILGNGLLPPEVPLICSYSGVKSGLIYAIKKISEFLLNSKP